MEARIYVGTYSAYNNASLKGKWFDLAEYDDKDAFIAGCLQFHKDEEDPEFMFQDWEGVPDAFIGESWIDEKFWDFMEACEGRGEDEVTAYMECFSEWNADDFQERYRGHFESWEDMAQDLLEESGALQGMPENLRYFFDYEKYARDISLSGDMVEHNGYFFWNH